MTIPNKILKMIQLNKEEEKNLDEAFAAICNLFYASEKDNFSKCSSFHIEPFNTHWDKKTVKEIMYHVKLYIGSWVIYPMEKALKKNRKDIEKYEKINHAEAEKRKKEFMIKQNKKINLTIPNKIFISSDENILQFVKTIKTKNDLLLRFVFIKSVEKMGMEVDFTEGELSKQLKNFFTII